MIFKHQYNLYLKKIFLLPKCQKNGGEKKEYIYKNTAEDFQTKLIK